MEPNNQLESDGVTLAQLTGSVLHRAGALSREEVARRLASTARLREQALLTASWAVFALAGCGVRSQESPFLLAATLGNALGTR